MHNMMTYLGIRRLSVSILLCFCKFQKCRLVQAIKCGREGRNLGRIKAPKKKPFLGFSQGLYLLYSCHNKGLFARSIKIIQTMK